MTSMTRLFGLAVCLLALAACGGAGDEAAAPPAQPAATEVSAGQSAQQSLGAGGGSVSLATREGASFMLVVPAGALRSATELRLVTAAASTRQRFHLRLEPAGLVLEAGHNATLTITLAAAMALPAGAVVAYDGVPLPVQRLADGRLQVRLASFAAAAAGAAAGDRAQALWAERLATTASPCGGAPAVGDFAAGGLTGSQVADLDMYGQCMVGAVQALATSGRYEDAVRAALATAALQQAGGVQGNVGNGTALAFVAQAGGIACTAQRSAIDAAEDATVQGPDHVRRHGQPVLMWQKVIEQLGAVCTQVSPTEYIDTMRLLAQAALDWYVQQLAARINNTTSTDYTGAVAAAQGHRDAVREVASLTGGGSTSQVDATAREQVGQRAQDGLVNAIVQGPWQRCRDSGNFDELIRLMQLGNELGAVKQAAQYCGTQLQAQAKNSAGNVMATLAPTLGGVRAGDQRTNGSIEVAKDGRLELSGPIRALQCPAGQAGGSESLALKLGNTVLQTITAAPYLDTTLTIDIAQVLQAAGIDAASFNTGTLTLTRTGSPCGGFWGANPAPLLTLELSAGLCVPESGRNYCVTVLADLNDPARDYQFAHAISNRGGHVLVSDASNPGNSNGALWHRGRFTPLPAGFSPWPGGGGAASLADDGSSAGMVVTHRAGLPGYDFMPAVFRPASGQTTDLLPAPLRSWEPAPQPNWSSYRIEREMATASISPQGRVSFTVSEFGNVGWADTDLGWCGQVVLAIGTGWDCVRYRRYEASGSGGAATLQQERQAPDVGELPYVLFDGGDGIGRVGHNYRLGITHSPSGGIAGYRIQNRPRRARELVADTPEAHGSHLAADRAGRTITQFQGFALLPASNAVPAGWVLGALGTEGHLQVCKDDGSARVLRLDDGQATIDIVANTVATHQGRSLQLYANCGAASRGVDALGRLLGNGWVESASRNVPVIFTPAGVALP